MLFHYTYLKIWHYRHRSTTTPQSPPGSTSPLAQLLASQFCGNMANVSGAYCCMCYKFRALYARIMNLEEKDLYPNSIKMNRDFEQKWRPTKNFGEKMPPSGERTLADVRWLSRWMNWLELGYISATYFKHIWRPHFLLQNLFWNRSFSL